MDGKGSAFVKGGCGCLVLFLFLAILAGMAGGHAHANAGGLVALFIIGGAIGLVVLAVYDKGRRDQASGDASDGADAPAGSEKCSACGATIPADQRVCPQCGQDHPRS